MKKLYAPKTILGTPRKYDSGAVWSPRTKPWRTASFMTGDAAFVSTDSAEKWWICRGEFNNGDREGAVKFATACISGFDLRFTYDKDSTGEAGILLLRNNVVIWSFEITILEPGSVSESFSWDQFTNPACGDLWEIRGFLPNSTNGSTHIDAEIISVY